MATITRTQIVDTLDANLNQMHQDGLTTWGNEYEKCFNVMTSTKQSEKDSYESGFTAAPEKTEGAAATYDSLYPGISKTYTHLTYALGYEITEEAIEDNLRTAETFAKLPKALAKSMEVTVERLCANIFNNGFTTAGFDGKALFATDHPILEGGTQANKPSTDVDLSVSSLTAGVTAFENYVDERNLERPSKAVTLLIPSDLWNTAEELLKSEYKPYVSNNEVNALTAKDLRYTINHYLTDTDAWFLLAPKGEHMLNFFWRVKPGALRRSTDFDSTNLKHLQRMRCSVGWSHYIGTYGSSGG